MLPRIVRWAKALSQCNHMNRNVELCYRNSETCRDDLQPDYDTVESNSISGVVDNNQPDLDGRSLFESPGVTIKFAPNENDAQAVDLIKI